jgi:hypothetical protein
MIFRVLLACIFSVVGSIGQTQQVGEITGWSGISSFGLSIEGGYQFSPDLRMRGGWMGGVSLNETRTQDGNTFDVDAEIGAIAMIMDFSPVDADWRVSGGVLFSRTSIESMIQGSASDPIEYNGQSFENGIATSYAEFDRMVSPMITLGYDYPFAGNWVMSGEIGAVFTGGLDVVITGDSAALQNAIDNDDDVQSSREDAADMSIYPYINVSMGYRF